MKPLLRLLIISCSVIALSCSKRGSNDCANVNCALPGISFSFELTDLAGTPLPFGTGNILPADSISITRSGRTTPEYCKRDTIGGKLYFSINAIAPSNQPLTLRVFRNRTETISITYTITPVGCCYTQDLKDLSLNGTRIPPTTSGLISSFIYFPFRF